MISATEAQQLFNLQPFTLEEVEQLICKKAITQSYTCFDKPRISKEVFGELQEAGYVIETTADSFIVRWK